MGNKAEYEATYRPELEDDLADWLLLLQIDSDEECPGWMWGDCGKIYFWIRERDLVAGDFSKVWLILQCT